VDLVAAAGARMKRFRRGLVVGKFCPLHRGHMLVIDAAVAGCDEVVVISYTEPPFADCGKRERESWLAQLYPQVRSVVLDDALPMNDAPDAVHRDFVGRICVEILGVDVDAVFTSEDYGDGFALALAAYFGQGKQVAHVCVDKARALVPISGTEIRRDPHAHRAHLDPRVYASFVKRIGILGGESSGKTTLAQALAARLHTEWVPEYGRELWEEKAGGLMLPDMLHIAEVQVAREERMAQQACRWLVCDTTPLTTLCYSQAMFGEVDAALESLAARQYDILLLCAPDFPFVQDGTRRDTDFRSMQHNMYRNILDEKRIAYTIVAGSLERRVQHALTLLI
jgi:HTH-type transcriptional regulator, transcriptional repressor of NAD biosynthesis genes